MTVLLAEKGFGSGERRCDARCHTARGGKCTCICHGRYHGRGGELAAAMLRQDVRDGLLGRELARAALAIEGGIQGSLFNGEPGSPTSAPPSLHPDVGPGAAGPQVGAPPSPEPVTSARHPGAAASTTGPAAAGPQPSKEASCRRSSSETGSGTASPVSPGSPSPASSTSTGVGGSRSNRKCSTRARSSRRSGSTRSSSATSQRQPTGGRGRFHRPASLAASPDTNATGSKPKRDSAGGNVTPPPAGSSSDHDVGTNGAPRGYAPSSASARLVPGSGAPAPGAGGGAAPAGPATISPPSSSRRGPRRCGCGRVARWGSTRCSVCDPWKRPSVLTGIGAHA